MRLKHLFWLLPVLFLLGLPASSANAQGTLNPIWLAEYWDNQHLHGSPDVVREENFIDNNWGTGSPADDIDDDHFSARWTADVYFERGTYRFNASSDDGVRVWVDGDLIIDAWNDHPVQTFSAEKTLSDGLHHIVVEYYEAESGAVMRFWWAPTAPRSTQTWSGEYYDNPSLRGAPVVRREDPDIAFNWEGVEPAPGVGPEKFSVRWTRSLNLPAGNYTFRVTTDDGARLWVNGRRVIDAWRVQSPRLYRGDVHLPGGAVPVRLEYFNNLGGAFIHLTWTGAAVSPAPPDQPPLTQRWRGQYYNGTNFAGRPAFTRQDRAIDFDWGRGSPNTTDLGVDRFAVRWERTLNLAPGRYRFSMTVDDGGRLWIDDRLLIDGWQVQSPRTYSGQITLRNRPVTARMEYFDNTGGAMARLDWTRLDTTPSPQPPRTWREAIPARYHPIMQRCFRAENFDFEPSGPRANWNSLLDRCLDLTRAG